MPIRIVIAEDNYLVRECVVLLLETCDDVVFVGVAEDYDGLLAAVDEHTPRRRGHGHSHANDRHR